VPLHTAKVATAERPSRGADARRACRFQILGLFGVGLPFRFESAPHADTKHDLAVPRPILDYWTSHQDTLDAIIAHVLVHEIGHHFGFSDDDMADIEAEVAD
jgi:predicted Zn-dependent protease with MMP-like domain